MLKVLTGITSQILTVFFQALNAKPPKSRDEIYHSNEWVKAFDPYCKQQPGQDANTVNFILKVPDGVIGTLKVEGGSLDFLDRCFKDAINAGTYGFMSAKYVLEAEDVLKKAAEEKPT